MAVHNTQSDFSASHYRKILTISAPSTEKLALFPSLKSLKPLSINFFG